MSSSNHGLSESQFTALQHEAVNAKGKAYCPYSNFRVGAAFLAPNGAIIVGANIENASYPVGTCAERVALGKAVFFNKADSNVHSIREFCPLDMPIVMFDKDGKYIIKTLEELLPMSFGPENLKGQGDLEVMQAGGVMEGEVAH
ncbi:MAG: hypothetical protein Q9184_002257 [Pyrenodesmia sp. 2 TL-2023]